MDNFILDWVINQFINIGKVIFQNSVNLVGWPIISVSGGPLIDQLLNNYQYKFTLNNPIQQADSQFIFDYRVPLSPYLNSTDMY